MTRMRAPFDDSFPGSDALGGGSWQQRNSNARESVDYSTMRPVDYSTVRDRLNRNIDVRSGTPVVTFTCTECGAPAVDGVALHWPHCVLYPPPVVVDNEDDAEYVPPPASSSEEANLSNRRLLRLPARTPQGEPDE